MSFGLWGNVSNQSLVFMFAMQEILHCVQGDEFSCLKLDFYFQTSKKLLDPLTPRPLDLKKAHSPQPIPHSPSKAMLS